MPTQVTKAIEILVTNVFIHSFIVMVCLHGSRHTCPFFGLMRSGRSGTLAGRLSGQCPHHCAILSVPLLPFIIHAAWVGGNRGTAHRLKGSVGSQIQARPLGVKVQPGGEHPGPGVPLSSAQGFPLSLLPICPRLWVGGVLCWLRAGLAYLESGEGANDRRSRGSCVGGLLVLCMGFVTFK